MASQERNLKDKGIKKKAYYQKHFTSLYPKSHPREVCYTLMLRIHPVFLYFLPVRVGNYQKTL